MKTKGNRVESIEVKSSGERLGVFLWCSSLKGFQFQPQTLRPWIPFISYAKGLVEADWTCAVTISESLFML
ncbi:hypothetical protein RJT34_10431 [Clitoria ternatea]|uniref:Uncharacterized protein n=1 Tax=Clitoria ternatea TaxID=43366 RepID=A0AAN9PW04_CLITE